jgi:hypothetical protein
MAESMIIAAPLLILALVLTLAFVGCSLDESGLLVEYQDDISNDPNIVSYWRLGEAPGATTAADSKDGNAGTYEGGVTLGVPGLLHNNPDTAAQFDGSSGYVSVPYTAALNPAKFTVEALVQIVGGDGTYRTVVSSRDYDPVTKNLLGYILYVNDQNMWEAVVGDGGSTPRIVTVGTPDAVKVGGGPPRGPYYLAMTYDGTNLSLYVNPVDQTDPDQVASKPFAYQPNAKNELRIGAGANESVPPILFFDGVIDEVAVYSAALDFATLQKHFAVMMMKS